MRFFPASKSYNCASPPSPPSSTCPSGIVINRLQNISDIRINGNEIIEGNESAIVSYLNSYHFTQSLKLEFNDISIHSDSKLNLDSFIKRYKKRIIRIRLNNSNINEKYLDWDLSEFSSLLKVDLFNYNIRYLSNLLLVLPSSVRNLSVVYSQEQYSYSNVFRRVFLKLKKLTDLKIDNLDLKLLYNPFGNSISELIQLSQLKRVHLFGEFGIKVGQEKGLQLISETNSSSLSSVWTEFSLKLAGDYKSVFENLTSLSILTTLDLSQVEGWSAMKMIESNYLFQFPAIKTLVLPNNQKEEEEKIIQLPSLFFQNEIKIHLSYESVELTRSNWKEFFQTFNQIHLPPQLWRVVRAIIVREKTDWLRNLKHVTTFVSECESVENFRFLQKLIPHFESLNCLNLSFSTPLSPLLYETVVGDRFPPVKSLSIRLAKDDFSFADGITRFYFWCNSPPHFSLHSPSKLQVDHLNGITGIYRSIESLTIDAPLDFGQVGKCFKWISKFTKLTSLSLRFACNSTAIPDRIGTLTGTNQKILCKLDNFEKLLKLEFTASCKLNGSDLKALFGKFTRVKELEVGLKDDDNFKIVVAQLPFLSNLLLFKHRVEGGGRGAREEAIKTLIDTMKQRGKMPEISTESFPNDG